MSSAPALAFDHDPAATRALLVRAWENFILGYETQQVHLASQVATQPQACEPPAACEPELAGEALRTA